MRLENRYINIETSIWQKGLLTDVPQNGWWHRKCAQQAAYNLIFKQIIQTYPVRTRQLKIRINNIPTLVKIMAWCRPGNKPLSEPTIVKLLTHRHITQWVKWKQITYKSKKNLVLNEILNQCVNITDSSSTNHMCSDGSLMPGAAWL